MTKIVLFNSPKLVGKDFAIRHLNSQGITLNYAECKAVLHQLTQSLFGLTSERYWEVYNNRELKEIPLNEFCGTLRNEELVHLEALVGDLTEEQVECCGLDTYVVVLSIRQAMIYVSEVLVKPRWGDDYFGVSRITKIKDLENYQLFPEPLVVDGSCAFVDELYPLIDYLGQDNILLLRIHRDGYTFEGDSRSYIPDGVITNTIDIYNNGTIEEYYAEVERVVTEFIND